MSTVHCYDNPFLLEIIKSFQKGETNICWLDSAASLPVLKGSRVTGQCLFSYGVISGLYLNIRRGYLVFQDRPSVRKRRLITFADDFDNETMNKLSQNWCHRELGEVNSRVRVILDSLGFPLRQYIQYPSWEFSTRHSVYPHTFL